MNPLFDLVHPYSRYGLAAALLKAKLTPEELTPENAPEVLARTIETGLGNFRLATEDHPANTSVLRFAPIKWKKLQENLKLVQSAGLASQGKYLAPTIVTIDGDAKGTYDNATDILKRLRNGESLDSTYTFSRSFAPTTAKINNGKSSQSPPRGTLFEAACSAIATLTPDKPAAWVDKANTVILPDLPMTAPNSSDSPLKDFIELFRDMASYSVAGDLWEAKLPAKASDTGDAAPPKKRKKKTEDAAPKSEFRRPRLYDGNYPFAPRNSALGPAGLLGAIGRWARDAGKLEWGRKVLESIAGTAESPGRPMYVISYDDISQVQFEHYIVNLSLDGKLSIIIDALIRDTLILSEMENDKPRWDSPAYKLFYFMASRFLQQFSPPTFEDFFATRAEYSPAVQPLFKEYFMKARKINKEIVESARVFGQWLNRMAYFVADSEVEAKAADRAKKVRNAKAKILVEFESAAMSAETPQDMLYRISTRAGRLLQQDAPAEATRFMDAANVGEELDPKDALHLLVAYMRLRTTKADEPESNGSPTEPVVT